MFFNEIDSTPRRMQKYRAVLLPTRYYSTGGEKMDNEKTIPYFAHEGIVARMERANRRLWILCIVLIILLAVTNAAWIYYESQFADETMTVTQDVDSGDGGDAIVNDGVHINGESTTDSNP